MHDVPDASPPSEPPRPVRRTLDPGDGAAKVRTACVAAFTCPETDRVGREVGFPLAVIAATHDPRRHAAHLSATRHAGWSPRSYDDWPLPFDDGLAVPEDLAYRQLPFDHRWLGRFPLPPGVTLEDGSLVVELPPGTCAADLSVILCAGMADRSYDRVARSPAMVRRRHATNRPVVAAPRYALLRPGDVERVVAVDDLFAFRPVDLPNLARAVALATDALAVGSEMILAGMTRVTTSASRRSPP